MNLLRHGTAGLLIFAVLVTILVKVDTDFKAGYEQHINIEKIAANYTDANNETIIGGEDTMINHLNKMQLTEGIARFGTAFSGLEPGTATLVDVLGGIASAAFGVLKIITGLLVLPYSISNVIGKFYISDPFGFILGLGLQLLITVYVGFIVISAYIKHEV
jgi:hypothetical protein